MATYEPSPDLDPQIAQAIKAAVDSLRDELLERLQPSDAVRQPASSGERLERLDAAVEAIDSAPTQAELLGTLLREAGAFAERALFLVLDDDQLKGWAAYGFEPADADVTGVAIGATGSWRSAIDSSNAADLDANACMDLCRQLGAESSDNGLLIPFALRGRVAGGLYVDRFADVDVDRPALRILTYVAAQALETLPLRRSQPQEEAPAPVEEFAETPAADAAPEPVFETTPEVSEPQPDAFESPEVEPEPEEEPEADASVDFEIVDALAGEPEPEPEYEAEPDYEPEPEFEPEPELEATPAESHETDTSILDAAAAVTAESGPTDEELEEQEAVAEEEPVEVEDDVFAPAATEDTPFATQEISTLETPMPEPAMPAAAVPPAEVRPPTDLDGPGWAFGGAEAASDDTRHEEARRLARLLVTEIKLYNEEKVKEGREGNNIKELLREDIDRSRRIYDERIDDEIRSEADYFQEECVRILAGGDSTALGA